MEMDEELEQDIKLGAIQKHILPKDGMMSNPVSSTQKFLYKYCYSVSEIYGITLFIIMHVYSFT